MRVLKHMSEKNRATLFESVRAQARLRASLGVPVCLLMLLSIWYGGPSTPAILPWHVITAFTFHGVYNVAVLLIVRAAHASIPRTSSTSWP